MLVHHADAGMDRIAGRADGDRLAADADLAGIGLVEAVEDRHQRRFAGAVLTDDAVDRAALDREVHVLVGVNGAEALVDGDEFNGGGHRASNVLPGRGRAPDPIVRQAQTTDNGIPARRPWQTAVRNCASAYIGHFESDM